MFFENIFLKYSLLAARVVLILNMKQTMLIFVEKSILLGNKKGCQKFPWLELSLLQYARMFLC